MGKGIREVVDGRVQYRNRNGVEGLNVRALRWNGCPSQELLVIRRNPKTGERSLDLLKWGLKNEVPLNAPKPSASRRAFCEGRQKRNFPDSFALN